MKKHIVFLAIFTILFAVNNAQFVRDFFYHMEHHVLTEPSAKVKVDGQWYYMELNNGYFIADLPGENGKVVYIHESLMKKMDAPCRFCQDEPANVPNIKFGVTNKSKILCNNTDKSFTFVSSGGKRVVGPKKFVIIE